MKYLMFMGLQAPRLVTAIKIRMKNPESLWAVIGSSFIIFDSHRRDSLRSSSIHFVHESVAKRSESWVIQNRNLNQ